MHAGQSVLIATQMDDSHESLHTRDRYVSSEVRKTRVLRLGWRHLEVVGSFELFQLGKLIGEIGEHVSYWACMLQEAWAERLDQIAEGERGDAGLQGVSDLTT